MTKPSIYDITPEKWPSAVAEMGLKSFSARQIQEWLYQKHVSTFEEMTNLAKTTRELLAETYDIPGMTVADEQLATDGTHKFAWALADGQKIESVLIPSDFESLNDRSLGVAGGGVNPKRRTLCISTQAGCAMGCTFCRTATMGLMRNLTHGEIVGQIVEVNRRIHNTIGPITNIVLMGMGEPLANYSNMVQALRTMYSPHGLKITQRKITLSTVGIAPAIKRLADEPNMHVKLALSLHAVNDEIRKTLIPMANRYPMQEIMDACRYYVEKHPRDRVTFEYLLIAGVNDRKSDADGLAKLIAHIPAKVNLIPFNPFPGNSWERPSDEVISQFSEWVHAKHIQVNIRVSRGREILAACGQLAQESSRKNVTEMSF
ncbi:MAG: 23S rRNA (adenine(2503)-C(2))-methyltransferase RlmN [Deltaproteobacteria bacterium CG11_big_fil_rev_8_21_14_0_20_47_16]|nr:MAG: 23S rRNA (adenine(2503)-C(2))-methyltransferase RlmN [Deltaproteobacteria bacterium CG11_big_fil_rev_8_21_14_0_20_47_16]